MPKGIYKHKASQGFQKGHKTNIGRVCLSKTIKKISIAHRGKILSEKHRIKLSDAKKSFYANGGIPFWSGKVRPEIHGSKSPCWIKDRSKLKNRKERNGSAYVAWRKQVWSRDVFKCKINNRDCAGRIEAHHILGWKSHPELRYQVNNGITLCHAHHPFKREEEAKLSPYFQKLVAKIK